MTESTLREALLWCAEYLEEISDGGDESCKWPNVHGDSWCSSMCETYGCAKARSERARAALAASPPPEVRADALEEAAKVAEMFGAGCSNFNVDVQHGMEVAAFKIASRIRALAGKPLPASDGRDLMDRARQEMQRREEAAIDRAVAAMVEAFDKAPPEKP